MRLFHLTASFSHKATYFAAKTFDNGKHKKPLQLKYNFMLK